MTCDPGIYRSKLPLKIKEVIRHFSNKPGKGYWINFDKFLRTDDDVPLMINRQGHDGFIRLLDHIDEIYPAGILSSEQWEEYFNKILIDIFPEVIGNCFSGYIEHRNLMHDELYSMGEEKIAKKCNFKSWEESVWHIRDTHMMKIKGPVFKLKYDIPSLLNREEMTRFMIKDMEINKSFILS
jgi:hypothetical protein